MRWFIVGLLVPWMAVAQVPYEVHEWGTFTSVTDGRGTPMRWRAESTDLPSFVYPARDVHCGGVQACLAKRVGKGDFDTFVRMETPVLYFYAPAPLDVSVKVDFPEGHLTEWYPSVRNASPSQPRRTLDWGVVRVDPRARPTLPTEPSPNHYYAAREVDAAAVRVTKESYTEGAEGCRPVPFRNAREERDRAVTKCVTARTGDEWERFLFYRGVGDFLPPLEATVTSGEVTLRARADLGEGLLFERAGQRVGVRRVSLAPGVRRVPRPLTSGSSSVDVRVALREALVESGLFEKEANAMLATWDDAWFDEGLRLFYLVPRAQTDALLPLTLKPEPTRLVRTMVGRLDLMTPEQLAAMRASLEALPTNEDLLTAWPELRKRHGRFTEVLVRRVTETSPALAKRAALLLGLGPEARTGHLE
ncbi:MAG: hypothetical protein MUC96_29270 [Myxococcaceae bacterium]|nr:hypothetical protein [Myxococcaceae bacterium]